MTHGFTVPFYAPAGTYSVLGDLRRRLALPDVVSVDALDLMRRVGATDVVEVRTDEDDGNRTVMLHVGERRFVSGGAGLWEAVVRACWVVLVSEEQEEGR